MQRFTRFGLFSVPLALALAGCAQETHDAVVHLVPLPAPAVSAATVSPRIEAPVAPKAPVDGPPAPEKRPVDTALQVDGAGLFLGTNETEAWLLVNGYSVVVDRATHCATESYPNAKALENLRVASDAEGAMAEIKRPPVLAAIRELVGLGRRFGQGTPPFSALETAFSRDGQFIYVATHEHLFRSVNGGRSFALADESPSGRPAMSPDGKHLVYEHCADRFCNQGREYASVATDGSSEPLFLTKGQTMFLGMTSDSRAMFTRSGSDVCIDTFTLDGSAPKSSVCVPLPPQVTGPWPAHEWLSVSPSGAFGIVKWEEGRRNLAGVVALTYVVSLVDLKTAKILKTVTDVVGEVDDQGNMVMQSMNEGGGDHTYLFPRNGAKKLLGNHSLSHWDGKVAMLSVWKKASLGARKCDLLKFVPTP